MKDHLLSLAVFYPMASAIAMLFIPATQGHLFRKLSLVVGVSQFLLVTTVFLLGNFSEEHFSWFTVGGQANEYFSAGYHVNLDGLSIPLFWLTSLVMLVALYTSAKIQQQEKGYYVLMLILSTAIHGTFAAADFLLFYLFFEFMLIPMYFLIGIWGGGRREYASLKFFIYTLVGSLFILIAMVVLYVSVKQPDQQQIIIHTFDLDSITGLKGLIPGSVLDPSIRHTLLGLAAPTWVFLLLTIGFAIKVPIIPFHTWLPDAHVEAPTPVSVILAALLLKTGAYGLIRYVNLIFPQNFSEFAEFIAVFALISIIYGAMNALASKDLKRMIAYSSISHMGFVILGICAGTSMAMQGAIYQMIAHGLVSTMLFLIAGTLQERTGDRLITNYSGFFSKMPSYSSMVLIGFFAGMGIPGFASFIGEILVLLGTYNSSKIAGWIPLVATLGILLSAGYFSWTIQRMLFGPFHSKIDGHFEDLTISERLVFTILAILIIFFGLYPGPLLDIIATFTTRLPN